MSSVWCIAIALRTGAKIFESTKCRCGKIVDELGLHGLSCSKNACCFPRHLAINSSLKRSLTRIGLPSTLEPVGLTSDARTPDCSTLGPWYRGLSLVWDARVVFTFAQGHYKDSARHAGFAATKAEAAKCQKCDLQSNYHFQPVAIETTGVYGKSTAPFLSGLTKKFVDVSGDPRECQWLHQRLSLAVARGNAASILACVQV